MTYEEGHKSWISALHGLVEEVWSMTWAQCVLFWGGGGGALPCVVAWHPEEQLTWGNEILLSLRLHFATNWTRGILTELGPISFFFFGGYRFLVGGLCGLSNNAPVPNSTSRSHDLPGPYYVPGQSRVRDPSTRAGKKSRTQITRNLGRLHLHAMHPATASSGSSIDDSSP